MILDHVLSSIEEEEEVDEQEGIKDENQPSPGIESFEFLSPEQENPPRECRRQASSWPAHADRHRRME